MHSGGFSADGTRVIIVERRGAVTLLDAATLDVVREPLLVDAELRGGVLSADVATVAVFRRISPSPVVTAADSAEVTSLSFDVGGVWLVTSGDDGVVACGTPSTVSCSTRWRPPAFDVALVGDVHRRGERAVDRRRNGHTYRWDLGTDAMVEHACVVAGRRLRRAGVAAFGDVPRRATCP